MDTFEAIRARRSIKRFKRHEMPPSEVRQLLELAVLSPTSYNIQNWRFVTITDQELKDRLCEMSYGQRQVAEASLAVILCADLKAWSKNPERYWKSIPEESRKNIADAIRKSYAGNLTLERDEAFRSCGMAAQTIMLAAKAMGYDTCPMEGFEFDRVGKMIGLPPGHIITMMIVVGKRASKPAPRGGQLGLAEVASKDSF